MKVVNPTSEPSRLTLRPDGSWLVENWYFHGDYEGDVGHAVLLAIALRLIQSAAESDPVRTIEVVDLP